MREIKFRAWDYQNNSMFYPHEIYFDEGLKNIRALDMMANYIENGKPRFVLMQYTGLKDKNGKEIYEGDIIKDESDGMITVIKWNNECAGFVNVLYVKDSKDIEVIGNIYENPELKERR